MKTLITAITLVGMAFTANSQNNNTGKVFETDSFETESGKLVITFIGHGTLMLEAGSTVIHIDPVSGQADYSTLPKGDLILVTHEHGDHLDKKALALAGKPGTRTVASRACQGKIESVEILSNGEEMTYRDIHVKAVPAYNIVNKRDGNPYHPAGNGNGYVVTFGNKRLYIAGDTENIPEMAGLKNIDIAFLPMNLPYTMTPEMVAEGARSFMPAILYPYHMGNTDPALLADLLKDSKIEVRIRKMK